MDSLWRREREKQASDSCNGRDDGTTYLVGRGFKSSVLVYSL